MSFSSYTSYEEKEIGNYIVSYGKSYSGYEDAERYHVDVINLDDFDFIDEETEKCFETKEYAYKKFIRLCKKYSKLVNSQAVGNL